MKKNLHSLLTLCLLVLGTAKLNAQIEPNLLVSAGGASGDNDLCNHTVFDTEGNSYVCGSFTGTTFFENTPLVSAGGSDIFIAKYNSSGELQWVKRAGGVGGDVANGLAVYGTEVYMTGYFNGTANFNTPSATGSNEISSAGSGDIFLAKYNSSGDFQWGKRAGGTGFDIAFGIVVSGTEVYITGYFEGTSNFNTPSATGSNEITSAGNLDIFLAKYNSSGVLQWTERAGGTGNDRANGIAVSGTEVYITGSFQGTANFNTPSATGSNEISSAGSNDIFLVKYNSSGTLQWAKRAGGTLSDVAFGIAVSGTEVYISGSFQGTANFNTPSATGSNEITSAGSDDIFLAKYNSSGTFQWAKRAGGTGGTSVDIASGIALSGTDVYIAGRIDGTANFNTPSATGSNEIISAGSGDIFLAKYNSSGTFQWAKRAGGTNVDNAKSISVNGAEVYVTGSFQNTANFNTPSAAGSNEITSAGSNDVFLAKYNSSGDFLWAKQAGGGGGGMDEGRRIAYDTDGNIYVCGYFEGVALFGNTTLISAGGYDIFLAKYNSSGTLQWAKRAGGVNGDFALGIAVSSTEVYITGYFEGTANFNTPTATGSNEIIAAGGQDIFLAKYNTSGNFQWVRRAGGTGNDRANGIAVSGMEVYMTGYFEATANFNTPSTTGSNEITSAGSFDIFLTKYSSSGDFQWAKRAGGTGVWDIAYGLAVSGTEVYMTGTFEGVMNFNTPSVTGSNEITSAGTGDIFLAKYNSSGTFQWAKRAGGTGGDIAYGIAVSGTEVYISGSFQGSANFNTPSATGSNEITSTGGDDIFLAKYNSNGTFQWAKRAGGINNDVAYSIAVSGSDVYAAGYFAGTANFNTPSNAGSNEISSVGSNDIFITKYNSSGTFQWAKRAGGTGVDYAYGLAVNSSEIYVTGGFQSTANFDTPYAAGSNELSSLGSYDIFIARFGCVTSVPTGSASQAFCNSATVSNLATTSGSNIQWYDAATGGNLLSSSTVLSNSTNYYTSQTANGCESNTRLQVTVTINAAPTVSVNSGSICSGNTFTIVPSGANTYTIQGGSTVISPTSNTTYTVIGESVEGCISANTATSNITVNTTPTVAVNNGSICSGNTFTIVPSGANTYTIEGGNTAVNPTSNTTYTVIGESVEGCISANTATSNITVNTTPTVAVNNGSICSGNTFTIVPSGANTYTIQGGNAVVSPTSNTTYTVIGESVEGCISANTATSNITVNTTPTVAVNNGSICSGNTFTIVPSGANTYTIQGGNTVISPTSNITYTVIGESAEGCLSVNTATSSVIVIANPTVIAITSNTNFICVGQTATLTATGAINFTWSTSETTAFITVSPTSTTDYSVTGTDANGCSDIAIVTQSVSTCTDIKSNFLNLTSNFIVYPNPSSGIFNIQIENDAIIEITDVLGRVILANKINAGTHQLNLEYNETGVYLVKVTIDGKIKIVKIVKE